MSALPVQQQAMQADPENIIYLLLQVVALSEEEAQQHLTGIGGLDQ